MLCAPYPPGMPTSKIVQVVAIASLASAQEVRIHMNDKAPTRKLEVLTNDAMSPLFLAVIEATEEAIYNSMLKATTMTANGHTAEALPIDRTVDLLKTHKVIR
jgi:D-aminopeptidase